MANRILKDGDGDNETKEPKEKKGPHHDPTPGIGSACSKCGCPMYKQDPDDPRQRCMNTRPPWGICGHFENEHNR
jgi:hypothetical protein